MVAAKAGVDTLEHVVVNRDEMFAAMREKGVILVPTLGVPTLGVLEKLQPPEKFWDLITEECQHSCMGHEGQDGVCTAVAPGLSAMAITRGRWS